MAQIINKQDIVVITDIGAVDPDDVLAICLLSTILNITVKGFITTHIYPTEKAKILKTVIGKMGFDAPVYVGNGPEYSLNHNVMDRNKFLKDNALFPAIFGYPASVYDPLSEKQWFPNFMKGYTDIFGSDVLDAAKIETTPGHTFLEELLKQYSPENKLMIFVLSPMHDIAKISSALYKNMDLYAMGGGFEEESDVSSEKQFSVNKLGYNWGVCPETTRIVLNKLSESKTSLTLISSSIVRRKEISVTTHLFDQWVKILDDPTIKINDVTKAIMADWFYSLKGSKLPQHKNLCDPLIVYLPLCKSYQYIQYEVSIADKINITNYLQPLDNIMIFIPNKFGNVKLITDFPLEAKEDILQILQKTLFPNKK